MKISTIKISNYRLLKDFEIDLENNLSLVIGKNNTGKTSFLSLLERFLMSSSNQFTSDDFNLDFLKDLENLVNGSSQELTSGDTPFGINLKLYIQYTEIDDLENISTLMLDLDPNIFQVILSFEYSLSAEKFTELRSEYYKYKQTLSLEYQNSHKSSLPYYLRKNHAKFFKVVRKALEFGNEANFKDLKQEGIKLDKIINFQRIKAKRDVTNKDGTYRESDKTLSKITSRYYEKITDSENEEEHLKELGVKISQADDSLTEVYADLFNAVTEKVKKFGGIKEGETQLRVESSLEGRNILAENTRVVYNYESTNHSLPEDYNGLGYMNLIALIFEIEVLMSDFKKKKRQNDKPADINLLFIEEPEAHTHPQMQYIFIKNIKDLLKESSTGSDKDKIKFNLQTIITTHSSHIVADSDFEDIRYLRKKSAVEVESRSLKKLSEADNYKFLKQYLTLNRAELFFADKAILIEGDTERLLIPAMMKKIDIENEHKNKDIMPLLSQNISVVEVGAYAQIFESFIDFLGIKTLIITDIDTSKQIVVTGKNKNGTDKVTTTSCRVIEADRTKNSCLNFFYKDLDFTKLKSQWFLKKVFKKSDNQWSKDKYGNLCIVYQKEEKEYHARSFEDAFIHLNREFITQSNFLSLKNKNNFDDTEKDAFDLAESCIDKKTGFATDILFHSTEDFSNWQIPLYIKEGLLWLQK